MDAARDLPDVANGLSCTHWHRGQSRVAGAVVAQGRPTLDHQATGISFAKGGRLVALARHLANAAAANTGETSWPSNRNSPAFKLTAFGCEWPWPERDHW